MSNFFQTTVYLQVVNGDDAELDIVIQYTVERGYTPSYMDTGAPDEVFIEKVTRPKSGKTLHDDFVELIDTAELRKNILAQYLEGLEGDRADYMRDLRIDREMDRRAA
jgi:hypothetical protein